MKKINKIIYSILILMVLILIGYTDIFEEIERYLNTHNVEYKSLSKEEFFQIQFIDVGQAESILIENDHKYVLVDAGNNKDGKKLSNYFKSLGIDAFEYVVATHAHEDHIGGMDNIIRDFNINHFYIPKTKVDNVTYLEVIEELKKKNIKIETPTIDQAFQVENTLFEVLSIRDDSIDLNNTSIVLKVTYFNNTFLLMSDATSEVEKSISEKDIKSDVLKVSHHGSRYSSSANFLYKVKPKYAVIQVGKNNDYDLPKQVVLDKLERIQAKLYRTDIDGTIIMTSDGTNITVETKETDTNQE